MNSINSVLVNVCSKPSSGTKNLENRFIFSLFYSKSNFKINLQFSLPLFQRYPIMFSVLCSYVSSSVPHHQVYFSIWPPYWLAAMTSFHTIHTSPKMILRKSKWYLIKISFWFTEYFGLVDTQNTRIYLQYNPNNRRHLSKYQTVDPSQWKSSA